MKRRIIYENTNDGKVIEDSLKNRKGQKMTEAIRVQLKSWSDTR